MTLRITVREPFRVAISHTPFNEHFREVVRSIEGREWDNITRTWYVPVFAAKDLIDKLRAEGFASEPEIVKIREVIKGMLDYQTTDISLVERGIVDVRIKYRKYQQDSIKFLIHRGSALAALDMGLGKTCISLGYIYYLLSTQKVKKAVVVCPKAVMVHWFRDARKFFGESLRVQIVGNDTLVNDRGEIKLTKLTRADRLKQWRDPESNIFVCNYELLKDLYEEEVKSVWSGIQPFIVIADEVTRAKTAGAQRTKNLRSLPAAYRVGLSGRPVENKLEELFTIMQWIWPNCFGTWEKFKRDHIVEETKVARGITFDAVVGYKDLERIRERLGWIMIRYPKWAVLPELPEIVHEDYEVFLSDAESAEYDKIAEKMEEVIASFTEQFDVQTEPGKKATAMSIFEVLAQARAYCDHPILVKNSTAKLAKELDVKCTQSSKLNELIELINTLSDEKLVIFSQSKRMIYILEQTLSEKYPDRPCFTLVGGMTASQQNKVMEGFRTASKGFFLSTDAGAFGIELQTASTLINYDLPYNPAVLAQREGRVHRIGQKNMVTIINMVVADLDKIERRVQEILKKKGKLYSDIIESDIDKRPTDD